MLYEKGIALVFEVSQGCKMACAGCQINKELSGVPPQAELDKLVNFITGFKEQGIPLAEFELGPTDMVKAANRNDIFGNPRVASIAGMFDVVTMNASFVYSDEEDYVNFARDVNYFHSQNNALQIPVDLRHLYSDKYLALIERNLQAYQSNLDYPLVEIIFTVILDELWMGNLGTEINYESLYERTKSLREKGYGFDFISHHGLKNIETDHVKRDFLKTIRKLNESFYDLAQQNDDVKTRRFDTMKNFNESLEVVYHEGELFIRPAVAEKSNLFHERMRYKGEWTPVALMEHAHERFNLNLEQAATYHDCLSCDRMMDCSTRFIHDVMAVMETSSCLTGLKHIPLPA